MAERLDFAVMVAGIEKPGDDVDDKPGIVLIDPWFVATEGGAARRAARGIDSFQELVALMPFLIVEAERQYLRMSPLQRPTTNAPETRPRPSRDPRAVPGRESDD